MRKSPLHKEFIGRADKDVFDALELPGFPSPEEEMTPARRAELDESERLMRAHDIAKAKMCGRCFVLTVYNTSDGRIRFHAAMEPVDDYAGDDAVTDIALRMLNALGDILGINCGAEGRQS